jgi:CheY-like chemotaxis protein
LQVKDDTNLLGAVETLVSDEGYRTQTAADGVDAMNVVAPARLDLVVSDVMMPRLDGVKLVGSLKGIPAWPTFPL